MMSEGGPITRSRSRLSSAAGAGDEQQQQQQQPEGMVVGKAAEPAPVRFFELSAPWNECLP